MMISRRLNTGISLIEVVIVFAVVSIMLTATMPAFKDQFIRARVSEGLNLAGPAKEALERTCKTNSEAVVNNNLEAGYFYLPSGTEEDYLDRILLGADCANDSMAVVIWTGNTGAETDPIIEWNADLSKSLERWSCRLIVGEFRHVPEDCRRRYRESAIPVAGMIGTGELQTELSSSAVLKRR